MSGSTSTPEQKKKVVDVNWAVYINVIGDYVNLDSRLCLRSSDCGVTTQFEARSLSLFPGREA